MQLRAGSALAWFLIQLLTSANGQASPDPAAADLQALAEKARNAVLLMVVCDASGLETAYGTGFLVASDGRLITNRHVARAGPSLFAKARTNKRYRIEGLLAEDNEHDLVLLKIEGTDLPSLSLGSSDKLEPDQPVSVVGNPLGREGILTPGSVVAVREFLGERGWIQIRADIAPGSSGSPVLDSEGKVIGIVTAMARTKPTQGLAVPVEVARRLLAATSASAEPRPLATLEARSEDDVFMDEDFRAAAEACFAKEYEEARKRAAAVVARFPRSAVAHLLLGHVREQSGAYEEAVAESKEATRLDPTNVMAWCGLGSAYGRQGKYAEACDALQQAVKLKPDRVEAWENLAWTRIQQRDFGRAADAYREATRLREDDEKLWYNLGLAYAKQDKQTDATWAFKVATKLKPDGAELWRELGTAYAKQGQYAPAAAALDRAVHLKPTDAVAIFNLGLAYLQLDQPEKARAMLDRLRPIDPKKAAELAKMLE